MQHRANQNAGPADEFGCHFPGSAVGVGDDDITELLGNQVPFPKNVASSDNRPIGDVGDGRSSL